MCIRDSHCKGRENVVADVLSRYPEDMDAEKAMDHTEEFEISSITIRINKEVKNKLKNITFHQLADKKLKSIIETVQTNPNHQMNDKYAWYKNKLYRKDRGAWKLMLTAELSRTLIYELHNSYSHIGNRRTYQLFKEYFTGDSINKVTQHIIKTCQTCQKSKDYYQRMLGETQPVIPKSKGCLLYTSRCV